MKKIILISLVLLIGCTKNNQPHPPIGGFLSEGDLNTSKNRTKTLNEIERTQIQDWINNQSEKFYPTSSNYWINVENLHEKTPKKDGEEISYQYDIYDFDHVKLYDEPKKIEHVKFGKFEELKPVEDALRYLSKNQEATLLIPSSLAFGTYGDQNKISNDLPVIIKLKVL